MIREGDEEVRRRIRLSKMDREKGTRGDGVAGDTRLARGGRRGATRGTATLVRKVGLREPTRERTMKEGEDGAERGRDETRCARRRGAEDENHTTKREGARRHETQRRNWGENR